MKTKRLAFVLCLLVIIWTPGATNVIAAPQQASVPTNITFETVVGGLDEPVLATNAGDGSGRLFIVEQTGKILIWNGSSLLGTPFLDVGPSGLNMIQASSEQGLLGLAFDPNYLSNGYFYIAYTDRTTQDDMLARFHVTTPATDNVADSSSAQVLLAVPDPESNHNGGMLAFGPNDGYLYYGIGDGGGGGDQHGTCGNGQNKNTMLGKLLRLDVSTVPYTIPTSNPFFGVSGVKQEIWAYGLRNPWRYSFDSANGDLYIGDVGQNAVEEIDYRPASSTGGENYGWRIKEGNNTYQAASGSCTPLSSNYVPPVTTYSHAYGCAVTGGYVYRGSAFPELVGVYLYGDFCSGKLWGMVKNASNQWVSTLIANTGYNISSFGEGEDGELYILDYGGQLIHITSFTEIADTFYSQPGEDGYVRESALKSNVGGATFASDTSLLVGQDQSRRQYNMILSFDTSTLPGGAVLTGATLNLLTNGRNGYGDPSKIFGPMKIDVRNGAFNNDPTLTNSDYQAAATNKGVGTFSTFPTAGVYSGQIPKSFLGSINRGGLTQFRVYFTTQPHAPLPYNNTLNLSFYSGENSTSQSPQLVITYYIP